MPIKEKPDEFAVREPRATELIAFLKAMEFGTITRRVAAHFEVADLDAIAAAPTVANVLPENPSRWKSKARRRRDTAPCARRSTTTPMSR